MSYETLEHPVIGLVRGVKRLPGVVQYLGIQYATLQDRFSRGKLSQQYTSGLDGVLDATNFGPIPLSPFNGCEHEHGLIQKSLPFTPFEQSDTECLTVNISVPVHTGTDQVPVMAFLHGGAFATGSSSYPQYDLARITRMSLDMGMPIVAVGINYRVGAPGFLYSTAMREAGYKTNNGLDDQRLALRWIRHNIAGFGGDATKITLVGESAGAASGCFQLHSAEPLFHQFVAMSGSSLQRLRCVAQADASFDSVVGVIEATELPRGEQQLQAVLKAPKADLVTKVGRRFPMGPLLDDDIIPEATTYKVLRDRDALTRLFPGLHHCKRVMMGDCQMDGMAFSSRVAERSDILPKTLAESLGAVFDPINAEIAPAIISAYDLNPAATSNTGHSTEPVLNFGNDVMFALPARAFAKAWGTSGTPGTQAFLCHFNCPNPWEGPWKGHASHIQDIVFVLQNYRETLSSGQCLCAERYARDLITFVCGAEPWPAHTDGEPGSMVYFAPEDGEEDNSGFVSSEDAQKTGRRSTFLLSVVGEEHLDKLVDAWQMFMAARK